LPPAPAQVSV
jgi:hypothetical protein